MQFCTQFYTPDIDVKYIQCCNDSFLFIVIGIVTRIYIRRVFKPFTTHGSKNPAIMTYLISHSDGFLVKDLSVVYLLPTALLGLLVVLTWRRREEPTVPIVNSYPGDITLKRAQSRFTSDARGLIKESIEKVSWAAFITNTASNVETSV